MINLKMYKEDNELLVKVLMRIITDYRPIKFGGNFMNNPFINTNEWLRLTDLLNKLTNQ